MTAGAPNGSIVVLFYRKPRKAHLPGPVPAARAGMTEELFQARASTDTARQR